MYKIDDDGGYKVAKLLDSIPKNHVYNDMLIRHAVTKFSNNYKVQCILPEFIMEKLKTPRINRKRKCIFETQNNKIRKFKKKLKQINKSV